MPKGFLRSWVATHVKVIRASDHAKVAKRLAAVCAADAAMAGIDPDDLDTAAGGDLAKYIGDAIDDAIMAELDKMLERVRPKDASTPQTNGVGPYWPQHPPSSGQ